ncbi:ATP-binding protein [Helcococcus ovis]|uniref:ATP-binding protein n=1 Tax=Helcococcus ovis TaxID=72026 RepID=UPI0038BCBC54
MKFQGENKASISERSDYGYGCILTTYVKIKNRLQAENICISYTIVRPRKDTYLFDYDCVNETILNALVHNDWTITEPQISMFNNRLEILSHCGLPSGITKEQFFDGISKPRNVTLMRIFLNMGLTEHTEHGIPMIVEKYGKDVFQIESNYIRCTIPFEKEVIDQTYNKNVSLNVGLNVALNKSGKKVIELLIENPSITSVELAEMIGVTKRTIESAFKSLQEKKMIERVGSK